MITLARMTRTQTLCRRIQVHRDCDVKCVLVCTVQQLSEKAVEY